MPERGHILALDEVRFGFAPDSTFLGPVNLKVGPGQFWGIVGPNGAGKSTLLRLMAGLIVPKSGTVLLRGVPLHQQPRSDRAKALALLPQHMPTDLDLTVRALVLLGRYPYRSASLFESAEDHRIADRAIAATELTHLTDRALGTLSGGEVQRAHLAAALAQTPDVLLLDEPTASLDLHHQMAVCDTVSSFVAEADHAAVVVTHDVNLAMQHCTHVLLMCDGATVACGPPRDVMTTETLGRVYRVTVTAVDVPTAPDRQALVPLGRRPGEPS